MISRKLAILALGLMTAMGMHAQSALTDDQVIELVKQQNAAGKDQKQIASELLSRGVSQQQIARLQKRLNQNATADQKPADALDVRTRVLNGETREEPVETYLEEEPTVKIFGHDIFRNKNLSFAPSMNVPTPANYVLGPGDEVILDIYGESQSTAKKTVSPDGTITVEKIGPIQVAGLNVSQAQAKVRSYMGEHYQGSSIKMTVGQTRTIIVNVMGEVNTPGTYTLSAFSTLFNALYMAGGVSDLGTLRNVMLSRNGKVITTVDIYDYIINGRLTGNVALQDNDVILVGPYENLVRIEGKVKRPMYYEMKKTEKIQALLNYAGGFTGDAYKQNIRVERRGDDGLTVHNVSREDFIRFVPEDGDDVVVGSIIERYKNTVQISGAVFRPGAYKIDKNAYSVKTLIEQAGGLMEQAVLSRAVLHRMKADRTLQTIPVDLKNILEGKVTDVLLQNEDALIIASAENMTNQHTLTIEGEVFQPGVYQFSEKETIEDLITRAGGLRESASLESVEVARRITSSQENENGKTMAKIYSFNLKKGLGISEGTGFELEPFDVVTIHRNPNYIEQKRIVVTGEVNYAGAYVISSKEERLSDLIKRAGGLTVNAAPVNARLMRMLTKHELDMKKQMLEIAKNAEDSISAMRQMAETNYNVGIDLAKALQNPGTVDDVILAEGDSLYIPTQSNVVKISGEVLYPNTVSFSQGKSVSYYLNQAGGVSKTGNKKQAYIVYANGQVSKASKGKPVPGCEIVVPQKIKKEVNIQSASQWIGMGSALASIAAVIAAIIRK